MSGRLYVIATPIGNLEDLSLRAARLLCEAAVIYAEDTRRTRVLIQSTDGRDEWGTVGVHDNIIEASLQALSDALEYVLVKR